MTSFSVSNTFTPSTVISSSEMNANFTAVDTAFAASLGIDGAETMTGTLKAANGTASLPALTFGADADTGIYRKGANSLGFAVGGTEHGYIDSSGDWTIPTGDLTIAAGDVDITAGALTLGTALAVDQGGTGATSASGARTSLGVAIGSDVQAFSSALTSMTGAIVAWPTATAPTGWLECDGSAVSRATYSALFAIIAETYGNGDGSTTFNLPDLRGEFIRGFDNSAGNDPDAASRTDRGDGTTGDAAGTKQAEDFLLHGHAWRWSGTAGGSFASESTGGLVIDIGTGEANLAAYTGTPGAPNGHQIGGAGGNETRPRNVSMMWIIKAL